MDYISFAKKFTSKANVVAKGAADFAQAIAEEGSALLAGSRVLADYRLAAGPPVATCGPLDMWKIFDATSKKQGFAPNVSIWILNKRGLQETHRGQAPPRGWDRAFEAQRRGCAQMARLKHPSVVKVVEPLEESASQMVLVTERVTGSLGNVLSGFAGARGASAARREARPSQLELKLGLLSLAEGLRFLHVDAGLAHCGLTPQVIMLAEDGGWRLAGFGFSVTAAGRTPANELHDYSDPFPPPWDEAARPALQYTAPELVGGFGGTATASGVATPAADMFSLGAALYEMLAALAPASMSAAAAAAAAGGGGGGEGGKAVQQLLPVRNSVQEYRMRLGGLQAADLSAVPAPAHGILRQMLSVSPQARPSAAAFASSALFQEDKLLRALQFLDSLLQREPAHKVAFVQDLSRFWEQFDDRLLRIRVVPALLSEMRGRGGGSQGDAAFVGAALPVTLSMMRRLGPAEFESRFLPLLAPLLDSAQGEVLALAIQNAEPLAALMAPPPTAGGGGSGGSHGISGHGAAAGGSAAARSLVPLLGRAMDAAGGPKLQEAALRAAAPLTGRLDFAAQRATLLPKVYSAALSTTSAGVRTHALLFLAAASSWMDKQEVEKLLESLAQITGVDKSAPTVVCAARALDAVGRKWGAELTATRLLPTLCPLLVAPSLAPRQFEELVGVAQRMLGAVQQKVAADVRQSQSAAAAAAAAAASQPPLRGQQAWDVPLQPAHPHPALHAGAAGGRGNGAHAAPSSGSGGGAEAAWKAREGAAAEAAAAIWQQQPVWQAASSSRPPLSSVAAMLDALPAAPAQAQASGLGVPAGGAAGLASHAEPWGTAPGAGQAHASATGTVDGLFTGLNLHNDAGFGGGTERAPPGGGTGSMGGMAGSGGAVRGGAPIGSGGLAASSNGDPFAVLSTAVLSQPATHTYPQKSAAPVGSAGGPSSGGEGAGRGQPRAASAWDSFPTPAIAPPPPPPRASRPPPAYQDSLI